MTVHASARAPRAINWGQPRIVVATLVGTAALFMAASGAGGWRVGLAALIGVGAGFALTRSAFGFTGAWRRMFVERRGAGVRAQLLMLTTAIAVFYPLLAHGEFLGLPLGGFVSPVGWALCLGAFVFGIGMQLGGGCGSGTLATVGAGNARMLATLAAFIGGSFLATANTFNWMEWPSMGAYSLIVGVGTPGALGLSLFALLAAYIAVTRAEYTRNDSLESIWTSRGGSGQWPIAAGGLALAAVNIATLVTLGRPWGITSAFALWGAKLATFLDPLVAQWPYWRDDPALSESVFADATSVMDFGLLLGSLLAAGLLNKVRPNWRIPRRSIAAAVIGGLMMGVGARLSTGCNIGALFSGLASGSAHGLVWLVFAVAGNAIGVRLRPRFGLES